MRPLSRSVTPILVSLLVMGVSTAGLVAAGGAAAAAAKPGVPTAVGAVMTGPLTAHVTWVAPASDGGAEISTYLIYQWPGLAKGQVVRPGPGQPIAMGADVPIDAGATATFVVVAENSVGRSGPSLPSPAVTAPGTPAAPTGVAAAMNGHLTASVSWTAPVVSPLTPVLDYEIRVAKGMSLATVPAGPTHTTVSLGDYGRLKSLQLVVLARTSSGTSVASAPSNVITTGTAPPPPTNVVATLTPLPGPSGCVTVTWTPPVSDPNAPITEFHVRGMGDGWSFESVDGGTTTTGCLGQYGDRPYQYVVEAENEYGKSTPSAPSNAVTSPQHEGAGMPAAPTGVTATLTAHDQVGVHWNPIPAIPGTADTDVDYMVSLTPGNFTALVGGRSSSGGTVTVTDPSITYTATVSVKIPGNHGPASTPSASVSTLGSPAAPTSVMATVTGDREVSVSWTAPPAQAFLPLTQYDVYAEQVAPAPCALGPCAALHNNPVEHVSPPLVTHVTFTGLDPNTSYRFTVRAWNAWSEATEWSASPPALLSNQVTTPTVNTAPTGVKGVQSSLSSVHVSWTPPVGDPLVPVTGYQLMAWSTGAFGFMTEPGSSYEFNNLVPGTYTFYVRAVNGVGEGLWSAATAPVVVHAAPIGAGFHAVTPQRILDSRSALGGFGGALTAAAPKALTVTNVGGVPSSATSVVMNVTATAANVNSFLTVYPAGTAKPNASNLNFAAGETIPNLVTVRVGTAGAVLFATAVGSTHVIADVVGFYDDSTTPGDLFNGVDPQRLLDSRTPTGGWNAALAAGDANARTLQVTGVAGVPATATGVVLNVTATASDTGSFLGVWPTGVPRPNASNLNFAAGQTISNLVTVAIGAGGRVSFFNALGHTQVVADVVAYFDPSGGSRFHSLTAPQRILDDRVANGLTGPWGPGQARTLPVAGGHGIAAGATGVVMNTTVTGGTQGSFITVYPTGTPRPTSSAINFGPGQTIPNLVMARLPAAGSVDIYNQLGSVDVIADAVGYFAAS